MLPAVWGIVVAASPPTRVLVLPPPPSLPTLAGNKKPIPPPHCRVVCRSANTMQTAKMFSPDPFPLQGDIFERMVKNLRGTPRDNYNALYHYSLLSKPKCWEDKLQAAQKRLCYPVFKPELWYESGAAGEFISSVQAVPVIGLHLVRRLNVLKYVSVSTYNGRVAVFSIRALEKISHWEERVELLPPEVRTWLEDPDVVVLTSGEKRTFKNKLHGLSISGQLDTEDLYKIYQTAGVIRPAVTAERGDLSWQLAYAVAYHPLPSRKSTWLQLIGTDKFKPEKKRDWPEWRMPGWQPDGMWRLDDRELFFLYFSTYGPHMFVSRLLRHGLVYGGVEAVAKELPLRDLFLTFLLGAMGGGELSPEDPLGLNTPEVKMTTKRDSSSPAVRMYNPKFAHLPAPVPKSPGGTLRAFPTPNKASAGSGTASADKKPERTVTLIPPPLPQEEQDPPEELQETDPPAASPSSATAALAPPPVSSDLEEGEIDEEGEEVKEREEELVIYLEEEGEELFPEEQKNDDNNNLPPPPKKRLPLPPAKKELKIQAALQRLAAPEQGGEAAAETETVRSPPTGVPSSLASRLGPLPLPPDLPPARAPAPGYYTTEGAAAAARAEEDPQEGTSAGPLRRGKTSPRYAPFDERSRRMPDKASAEAYRQEAAAASPLPVAVIAPDRNLCLAARTKRGPKPQGMPSEKRRADRRRHRALSRRLLDHIPLTQEEVYNNAYVEQPIFDKRCSFCASWHCSRFLRGTREPNCRKFREQKELAPSRRLCDYRRCLLPNDHHTAVCPALHNKCPVCHCRGHGVADSCNMADNRIMDKLRYDFEECADIGIYTKKRFQNLAWGFYPYPASAPRDVAVVSYRRLSDMPIDCAFSTLKSILQLPENRPLPQGGLLDGGLYLAHRRVLPLEGGVPDPRRQAWEEETTEDEASY